MSKPRLFPLLVFGLAACAVAFAPARAFSQDAQPDVSADVSGDATADAPEAGSDAADASPDNREPAEAGRPDATAEAGTPDSGTTADAARDSGGVKPDEDDGDCGCRVGGGKKGRFGVVPALGAVGVGFLVARRARRRRD